MQKTQHFGRIVRAHRKQLGFSIEKAAELCGISYKGLEKIEFGDSNPRLTTVLNIVVAMQLDLRELNACLPPALPSTVHNRKGRRNSAVPIRSCKKQLQR